MIERCCSSGAVGLARSWFPRYSPTCRVTACLETARSLGKTAEGRPCTSVLHCMPKHRRPSAATMRVRQKRKSWEKLRNAWRSDRVGAAFTDLRACSGDHREGIDTPIGHGKRRRGSLHLYTCGHMEHKILWRLKRESTLSPSSTMRRSIRLKA